MRFLLRWAVSTAAVAIASYLLPGAHVEGALAALVTALVLGFFNGILRPILFVLTLPLTVLSLGLFYLVLNALMVLLTDQIVPGFSVDGFWWALLFSLVLSLVNLMFGEVVEPSGRRIHWHRPPGQATHGRGRSGPSAEGDVIDVEVVEDRNRRVGP